MFMAVYKLRLQKAYYGVDIMAALNFSMLLDCLLIKICDVIMGRDWSNAFVSNGVSLGQGGVSIDT